MHLNKGLKSERDIGFIKILAFPVAIKCLTSK